MLGAGLAGQFPYTTPLPSSSGDSSVSTAALQICFYFILIRIRIKFQPYTILSLFKFLTEIRYLYYD